MKRFRHHLELSNPRKHTRAFRIGKRQIITHGLEYNFWTDLHHLSMTASWLSLFLGMALAFILFNGLFAVLYALGDGAVANARHGHPLDYFFFSIETFATVGYGVMYPDTLYGHTVASIQIFLSIFSVAVMTGLIFSRFSRPRARLIFARHAVIGQHDGHTMLMIRMANARHNALAGARAKLWMARTETLPDGKRFRRFYRLPLERDENPTFILSWTIFHEINESSPLHDLTMDDFSRMDVNFIVTINGLDENMAAEVNDRHVYVYDEVRINHRYADIIESVPGGTVVHYEKFHDIEEETVSEAH